MKRIYSFLFTILIGTALSIIPDIALAKKGGSGGGGGTPDPDPPACTVSPDDFPSFAYGPVVDRMPPVEIWLSSSNGCRRELAAEAPDLRGPPTIHMASVSGGIIGIMLWTEEPNNDNHYVVYRLDFSVNTDGDLDLGLPTVVLLESSPVPQDDQLYYFSLDVWGNADHSDLSLLTRRIHVPGGINDNSIRELRIYNLNELTEYTAIPAWSCTTSTATEFDPNCYSQGGGSWSPSGTHLYVGGGISPGDGSNWSGLTRVDIDKSLGTDLEDWVFGDPKLVYTSESSADRAETGGAFVRPGSGGSLGNPEMIAMKYLDRTGRHTQGIGVVLNADTCVGIYAAIMINGGGHNDSWLDCLAPGFVGGNHGRHFGWQSPEALLTLELPKRNIEIHRLYVLGDSAGTSEVLIENADFADTGQ